MIPTNIFSVSSGILCSAALAIAPLAASGQSIINFSDLTLDAQLYEQESGGFTSGGAFFNNSHGIDPDWGFAFWGGWAYSRVIDTETGGFGNQFASFAGGGYGTNEIYGIGYVDTWNNVIPTITLPAGTSVSGVRVSNTTYAALTMLEEDPFGFSDPFTQGDYFYLTITGWDSNQVSTGSIDFYLADFRFEDESLYQVIDEWVWVDLTSLGNETMTLTFEVTSSDPGTPYYFALGEMALIPEPGTYALLAGLAAGALAWRRRQSR